MTKTILTVAACATVLCIGTAQGAMTPQQKCQSAKIKARAKYHACVAKAEKSDVKVNPGSGFPNVATTITFVCLPAFAENLAKADAKASAAGSACRYVDNNDGTLIDLNTGLVWEKKDDFGGVHDQDNAYTWSSSGTAADGTAFTTFLATLNGGTSSDGINTPTPCFTGHCDWRLPTVQELAGIVDPTQGVCGGGSGACIDPAFGLTLDEAIWSVTTFAGNPIHAWFAPFYDDYLDYLEKTSIDLHARAVRGGL